MELLARMSILRPCSIGASCLLKLPGYPPPISPLVSTMYSSAFGLRMDITPDDIVLMFRLAGYMVRLRRRGEMQGHGFAGFQVERLEMFPANFGPLPFHGESGFR